MVNSKKAVLYLSILIISIYWIYQFIKTGHSFPTSFSDFAVQITIVKLIQLFIMLVLLKLEGDDFSQLGFVSKNLWKQLLFGLVLGMVMFLTFNVVLNSIISSVFPKPSTPSMVLSYFEQPQNIFIWLLIGIFGGGLVEEVMRIFVLTRFEKAFHLPGLYFALTVSSLVFGIGHLYQGIGTAITTGLSGLVLGIIFIKRRSALEVITIHAFSDVLAILGAFRMAMNH